MAEAARVAGAAADSARAAVGVRGAGAVVRLGGDRRLRVERSRLLLRAPAALVHARLLSAHCYTSKSSRTCCSGSCSTTVCSLLYK